MKKLTGILAAILLMTGCSAQDDGVFETIGEMPDRQVWVEPDSLYFDLPEQAANQAGSEQEGTRVYQWDDFTVSACTVQSGNLDRTLAEITGMDAERLTVMKRQWNGMDLYQTVWCAAGAEEVVLGRVLIADDGAYHYCVSITGPEDADSLPVYEQIVSSLRVGEPDSEK